VNQGMISKRRLNDKGSRPVSSLSYPAHGVGQILAIEEQEVAGCKLELFVITFVKDKMTLRVPTAKITAVGMRKLAEPPIVKRSLDTLKGRARVKRTMWSRRARNTRPRSIPAISSRLPKLSAISSVPTPSPSSPTASGKLYEAALDRLSREISAVQRITETEAVKESKPRWPKGRAAARRPKARKWSSRKRRPEIRLDPRTKTNESPAECRAFVVVRAF